MEQMQEFLISGPIYFICDKNSWAVDPETGHEGFENLKGILFYEGEEGHFPAFSDEDLARRFVEASGEDSWEVAQLSTPTEFISLLKAAKQFGIHNITFDKKFETTKGFQLWPINNVLKAFGESLSE